MRSPFIALAVTWSVAAAILVGTILAIMRHPEFLDGIALCAFLLFGGLSGLKAFIKRGQRVHQMHDTNAHPWQAWADEHSGSLKTRRGLTIIRGTINERSVAFVMGGWLPGSRERLAVKVPLHPRIPDMKPRFFQGTPPTLRMQALLNNEGVKTLRAALRPDRIEFKKGALTLTWRKSSSSSLQRVEGTVAFAQSLEESDGASWQTLARAKNLQWSTGDNSWHLQGNDNGLTLQATYTCGSANETTITVAPTDDAQWTPGLSIQTKTGGGPSMHTGNPVLDGMVSVSCTEGASLPAALSDPDQTGTILSVIKGHGGQVIDGAVRITVPELVLDIGPLFEDATSLARALLQD